MYLKTKIKKLLILLFFVTCSWVAVSQNNLSEKYYHFNGSVTVTNNGISLIPSFSLDKSAVIFDLLMGGEKLSFDPQFRFSLEGKPWSFIFWWRYKLANNDKFMMHIGAHPALMFHSATFEDNGVTEKGLEARRFVAAEISPTIFLTKNISLKPYYLVGHGFDRGLKNAHYVTMRASISNLGITDQLQFSLTPEVYYLKMDSNDGYYFASSFSLTHNKSPISLCAMINKKLESEINGKDFIWNVSLVYSFGSKYLKG